MLPKNIIICADGTGNKGGYSPDSNVYKVYTDIDKHYKGPCKDDVDIAEQILFYDNGVGTAKNKYWRALSAAFGLGFKNNICDLYKFLARNYMLGDRVYFFGFSRGASTVRACSGMIAMIGLVKGQGLRNSELDDLVEQAFIAYRDHKKNPVMASEFKNDTNKNLGSIPIKFLGVWDTVVALGFPKRTDITGPVTLLMNAFFVMLENVFNVFFPHCFYHYKLTDNVEYACQALAIDDERTAFWPYVWQEKNITGAADRTSENVEQVWFSGMHSNVGGGYARAGMACVPLHWMMKRAQHHGLMFFPNALKQSYDESNVHGRMYNSRSGFASIYRYHPREIEHLCDQKLLNNINIHYSVIERLEHRTANYAVGHLPGSFDVVDDDIPANRAAFKPVLKNGWSACRNRIDKLVMYRKRMYGVMLSFLLTVFFSACCLWGSVPDDIVRHGFKGDVADILDYFSPDFFDGLIEFIIMENSWIAISMIFLIVVYFSVTASLYKKTVFESETLRHYIISDEIK